MNYRQEAGNASPPVVGIIVPCFNEEEVLGKTLPALLSIANAG